MECSDIHLAPNVLVGSELFLLVPKIHFGTPYAAFVSFRNVGAPLHNTAFPMRCWERDENVRQDTTPELSIAVIWIHP
jgi:hypothetical protein